MTIVIGLTGSIASGKSMISERLISYGIPVIDADKIAREVVEKGEPAYEQIVATFGESILLPDESINRASLGEIIFNNEEKRKSLNAIVHPAVRKEMLRQRDSLKEHEEAVVLDIPLLFESKLTDYVEKILVISVNPSIQLERLMKRSTFTREEAQSRISSQIPVKEKEALADAVIYNNETKANSYKQLDIILKEWGIENF